MGCHYLVKACQSFPGYHDLLLHHNLLGLKCHDNVVDNVISYGRAKVSFMVLWGAMIY